LEGDFYKNGLKFECVQCSNCCRIDPGYVFLSYNDLHRLKEKFNLTEDEFIKKYCRIVNMGEQKRISLIEKSNYDCIFWNNGGCEIYELRPLQCKSYPFWKPFLVNKKAWHSEAESCPGMNKGAKVDKKTIDNWLKLREDEEYILL